MAKPGRLPLHDQKVPITWAKQMSLEKVNETTFKSLAGTPYASFVNRNGEQRPRAYGGHVYAQAAYAASKTVPGEFIIHVRLAPVEEFWKLDTIVLLILVECDWLLYSSGYGG